MEKDADGFYVAPAAGTSILHHARSSSFISSIQGASTAEKKPDEKLAGVSEHLIDSETSVF